MSQYYFLVYAFYTLYKKECMRFLKVYGQTLLQPTVSALLFLFVFSIAVGNRSVNDSFTGTFIEFIIPGLVMMNVIQHSFSNSASSILMYKMMGTLQEVLESPLPDSAVILAYILAAATRGLLIGTVSYTVLSIFGTFELHSAFLAIFYAVTVSATMGAVGVLCSVYMNKFDQLANITTLVIMPFSFLSGTFYSIERLPGFVQIIAHFNPFFYMIDGMRYALTGYADTNVALGITISLSLFVVAYGSSHLVFKRSNRVRS